MSTILKIEALVVVIFTKNEGGEEALARALFFNVFFFPSSHLCPGHFQHTLLIERWQILGHQLTVGAGYSMKSPVYA